ncbi:MAG: NAD(P)-dependent oxidoreductase [Nitrospinae bacterium]|nr:NAD(P)-dependent oxidoreductase [Nitrospinota bacterium]
MKKALVTGGAGFIGRWLVKRLLDENVQVWVIDNLDNGKEANLAEFKGHPLMKETVFDDILNRDRLQTLFREKFDMVYHLAAQINVHESLANPKKAYEVNVMGTYNVLEECRAKGTKLMLMGTCMVYDVAHADGAIGEKHPLKPASPYAGSKLAAEILAESYHHAYGLPIVTCRPFNTYGPFQKSNLEGGVVSVFVKNSLNGEFLNVHGDGSQTRDLLYVEDCVEFIHTASKSEKAVGQVLNAGLGKDISVIGLARMISPDPGKIRLVPHHHPNSEIQKLVCDYSKARALLNWEPKVTLESGIRKLRQWLQNQCVSA